MIAREQKLVFSRVKHPIGYPILSGKPKTIYIQAILNVFSRL